MHMPWAEECKLKRERNEDRLHLTTDIIWIQKLCLQLISYDLVETMYFSELLIFS